MKSIPRTSQLLLTVTALMIAAGCGGGSSTPSGGSVIVQNNPPEVKALGWSPSHEPLRQFQSYQFAVLAQDPDIGDTIAKYDWSFDEGKTYATTTEGFLRHAFTTPGSPVLLVRATDNRGNVGAWGAKTLTVTEAASPVTLVLVSPVGGTVVQGMVGASAQVSYVLQVRDTNPGGVVDLAGITFNPGDANAQVVERKALGNGQFSFVVAYPTGSAPGDRTVTATFQAVDNLGSTSAVLSGPAITIRTTTALNQPPVVTLVSSPLPPAGPNAAWQGALVQFSATATDPDNDSLTYTWTFGDGGKGDVPPTQNNAALNQEHIYATPGVYPVVLTVDDGRPGGRKVASLELNVKPNTPPTLNPLLTPAAPVYAQVPIKFESRAADVNGDALEVTWEFGDNQTDTGATVTHTYAVAGNSVVKVQANDGKGGITSQTFVVNVLANRAPTASVLTPPAAGLLQGKAYTFTAQGVDPEGDPIQRYEWDFGDGTPVEVSTTPTIQHAFALNFSGNASVRVRAVDVRGSIGDFCPAVVFGVVQTATPVVTFTQPTTALSLNVSVGGTIDLPYIVKATHPNAGQPGVVDPIPLDNIGFSINDAEASLVSKESMGNGAYRFFVRYRGAAVAGSRKTAPSAYAIDSKGVRGLTVTGPELTLVTGGPNRLPVVVVTEPDATAVGAFTSRPVNLGFTITDPDGDPVSYVVDWGDGSEKFIGTSYGDTKAGIPFAITHVYPDSFTSGRRDALVTISAIDGRDPQGQPVTQTRTFQVVFNTLPVARITGPTASATLPSTTDLPSDPSRGLFNPPGPNDPEIVVIPNGSRLSFKGEATLPGSQDATLLYSWTFERGIPRSADVVIPPGDVVFQGTPGKTEAFLVTFTVKDAFGRSSAQANPSPRTYKKWIVVDGKNSQDFTLRFMYRTKAEDLIGATLVKTLAPAAKAETGLGATISILQDGAMGSFVVADQANTKAEVKVPVRANMPFYVKIPAFGPDGIGYVVRIPNAPTGPYADPTLGTTQPASTSPLASASAFWFENPTAAQAPWNPVLQIVTGEGFSPELTPSPERRANFGLSFTAAKTFANTRWVDRVGSHITASGPPHIPFEDSTSELGGVQGARAYQLLGEWFVGLGTLHAKWAQPVDPLKGFNKDDTASEGKPNTMGFTFDVQKYGVSTQKSETFTVAQLQAMRIPPHTADPFDLDDAKWGTTALIHGWKVDPTVKPPAVPGNVPDTTTGVIPTSFAKSVNVWFADVRDKAPGGAPLSGGLRGLVTPYEMNYPGFPMPTAPPFPTRTGSGLFSYAEYLWSSHWSRPLVLNLSLLNSSDGPGLASLPVYGIDDAWPLPPPAVEPPAAPSLRYSATTVWPKKSGITGGAIERPSAFDMTPSGGGTFTAGSPVALNSTPVTPGGVGRFYWTGYGYEGGVITRSWLSNAAQMPPSTFLGGPGDATNAVGMAPPLDIVVDKRDRDIHGKLTGAMLGGYRITWFNPTLDNSNQVVPPDFWVVEVDNNHFVLPASYPVAAQGLTDVVMTDARTYLPSGNAWGNPNIPNPANPEDPANDKAVPGFCWFDIPKEFQPDKAAPGSSISVRVYGVKAILKNNAVAGARRLNRVEWMEAIKTITTPVKVVAGGGDTGYAHKIPFNYAWDIVVVQSAQALIAP